MHFVFEGDRYIVSIASRPIVHEGETCRARIDFRHKRILLCSKLGRHERRKELFHELTHAWRDKRGMPYDQEHDARETGEMLDEVMTQYLEQGGDAVLEGMDPPADAPTNPMPSGPLARTEAECGYCHAMTAVGSIGNDPPEFNQDAQTWTLGRGILCGVCDHVTVWREFCTSEGMPTGRIVPHPPPRVIGGEQAAEWIFRHAKTIGAVVTR